MKFQSSFLNIDHHGIEKDFDPKKYIHHILNKGNIEEKRALVSFVKNKIILKEKKIVLE